MRIGLIGYGRMGHEIEEAAINRGHSVVITIDVNNPEDFNKENLVRLGVDVMIEFSSPVSAFENVCKCLNFGVPVVSGTTGWTEKYSLAAKECIKNNTSFIHSSNFSIGVNLFFKINALLSAYINDYNDYRVSMEEIHHIKKLDAPSGTAITTAEKIIENSKNYSGWYLKTEDSGDISNKVPIVAIREGAVPGTHSVEWNSPIDSITIKHEARNRKGFATGAVVAAEYIFNKKGIFTMSEVLGL
jgi:4-hydroxy-tetrahydrodipicolinate reductase